MAVSPQSLGNYWFLIVGGWVVLGTSYLVATVLRYCFPISNQQDFVALRVASTFPNIVALPILIFPSLCEFQVVYEGYAPDYGVKDVGSMSSDELRAECAAQSTTMIFCYFFAWSLAFWSFGYPQLMRAAKANNQNHQIVSMPATPPAENSHHTTISSEESSDLPSISESQKQPINDTECLEINDVSDSRDMNEPVSDSIRDTNQERTSDHESNLCEPAIPLPTNSDSSESVQPDGVSSALRVWKVLHPFWQAIKQTTTSPGFIAMVLAFLTACIPPLQRAMFEPGGPLRFFGSAMEALGTASSPISTMVVAASLVPPPPVQENPSDDAVRVDIDDAPIFDEQPGMTDPNFGPYQRPTRRHRRSSRFRDLRRSLRSSLQAVPRSTPEMRRLHIWFTLSRLIVAPAVVVGLIMAFDCSSSTALDSVPNLAKLVIIVNASLPGALIIVVLLKAQEECTDTAAALSKVYLPSYLLSIFTIAAWSAVGLWITIPDEEGNSFCQR